MPVRVFGIFKNYLLDYMITINLSRAFDFWKAVSENISVWSYPTQFLTYPNFLHVYPLSHLNYQFN